MTIMNIYQENAHPDMQCNEDQSQWSIARPTHNQCKIHEVFASRNQDPIRAQVWGTKDILAISKSTKKVLQSSKVNIYWI